MSKIHRLIAFDKLTGIYSRTRDAIENNELPSPTVLVQMANEYHDAWERHRMSESGNEIDRLLANIEED